MHSFTETTRSRALSAKCSINSSLSPVINPDCPNSSSTPTFTRGVGRFSDRTQATASPRPLMSLQFSAVTIAPVRAAASMMASSSIGFDGADVEEAHVEALFLQQFDRFYGLGDHVAGGDDGRVLTVPQRVRLADIEGVVIGEDPDRGSG